MDNLRDLPKTAAIVLFTPVITPAAAVAAKAANDSSAIDPFEILGRSLASYHPRVRHVPYVPGIGFTDTHDAFLSQVDAVIVVLCEPHGSKRDNLASQLAFAERTREVLSGRYGGPVRSPPILVQCGDLEGSWWPDVSRSFEIVLRSSTLSAEISQHIPKKLFGTRK